MGCDRDAARRRDDHRGRELRRRGSLAAARRASRFPLFGLDSTYPGNVSAIGYVLEGKIVRDAFDVEVGFTHALQFHEHHHDTLGGRLRVHLSPHAPDTVPEEFLRETRKRADELGTTIHLHLAQHLDEDRTIRERHGLSPVKYLEQIGFLGSNVLATHVTYTDEADWDAIARTGTNVVHTAYRKAKEGLTSPFWEYLERGTNVCMATDSFSTRPRREPQTFGAPGKVRERSVSRPTAEQVLRCATHGAGRALARPELGVIEPGALGDVLVLDMTSPFNSPVFYLLRAAVYYGNAGSVRHSLVDGRPVVQNGQVVGADVADVRARCEAACRRLWELASEEGALPEESLTAPARPSTHAEPDREGSMLLKQDRTALVVVDMQNGFCHSEGSFAKLGLDVPV